MARKVLHPLAVDVGRIAEALERIAAALERDSSPAPAQGDVLDLDATAQLLKVQPRTLRRWLAQGGDVAPPGTQSGPRRSWRFHRPAVLEWQARRALPEFNFDPPPAPRPVRPRPVAQASLALGAAPRPRNAPFTPEELDRAAELLRAGKSPDEVGTILGRNPEVIRAKRRRGLLP